MKERLIYLDLAKIFAIFLVVWGHSIQNLAMEENYWLTDRVSQFIISFHMPLFMIISGFLAYNSLSKPILGVMKKKAIQLLLPSISWCLIVSSIAMIFHRAFTWDRICMIVSSTLYSYWFLKALFVCYTITMIGAWLYRWQKWSLFPYILLVLSAGDYLNYCNSISMLPFFCTGLLIYHIQDFLARRSVSVFVTCLVVFIGLFSVHESAEYNIYLNPLHMSIGGG